mmetsp:Transcript_24017/g.52245  ORF Transcript_24017/g.52245 Transcript_24017/m.52245 type:complete len:217 (-) Transcript_24017:909-1559(-)
MATTTAKVRRRTRKRKTRTKTRRGPARPLDGMPPGDSREAIYPTRTNRGKGRRRSGVLLVPPPRAGAPRQLPFGRSRRHWLNAEQTVTKTIRPKLPPLPKSRLFRYASLPPSRKRAMRTRTNLPRKRTTTRRRLQVQMMMTTTRHPLVGPMMTRLLMMMLRRLPTTAKILLLPADHHRDRFGLVLHRFTKHPWPRPGCSQRILNGIKRRLPSGVPS